MLAFSHLALFFTKIVLAGMLQISFTFFASISPVFLIIILAGIISPGQVYSSSLSSSFTIDSRGQEKV